MEKKYNISLSHDTGEVKIIDIENKKEVVKLIECDVVFAYKLVTAITHHDELVEALKAARSYFEKYNCGGHTKDYDGKIYMDQGSAYLKTWLALSKLPQ